MLSEPTVFSIFPVSVFQFLELLWQNLQNNPSCSASFYCVQLLLSSFILFCEYFLYFCYFDVNWWFFIHPKLQPPLVLF